MQAPILIVEDDYNDVLLLKRAFSRAKILHPLVFVQDADEAISYLSAQNLPVAILTDWGNAKGGGLSVLKWIQENGKSKNIPVTVLSGSVSPSDMEIINRVGASFVPKPSDFRELEKLLIQLYQQ